MGTLATNKLTALTLGKLKRKSTRFKLVDGGGLYLFVPPIGELKWQMAYRFHGKQRTHSIGHYPTVSLAQARAEREKIREQLEAGMDPAAVKRARDGVNDNEQVTFEKVAREWHTAQVPSWDAKYAELVMHTLEHDLLPVIWNRPIGAIEPPTLLNALRKIEDRGAATVPRKARGIAGRVFRYAIGLGLASRDPSADLVDVLKKPPRVRHHAKLSAGELPAFFSKLAAYDGQEQTRVGLELILRTMVRTVEARYATRSEFENLDGKEPLWRIPPERMKMKREHLVPLTPEAVKLVKRLFEIAGQREWLFPKLVPNKKPSPVVSENTFLFALYRMGYYSRATVQGFTPSARPTYRRWEALNLALHPRRSPLQECP
jgi:integrase